MKFIGIVSALLISTIAVAAEESGKPSCKAELNDEFNMLVSTLEWKESFFTGHMKTPTQAILITTSLGNEKVMSLWVREKNESPNGMFSFVDLSSGRDQYLRFYMADGYSLGVTCRWE